MLNPQQSAYLPRSSPLPPAGSDREDSLYKQRRELVLEIRAEVERTLLGKWAENDDEDRTLLYQLIDRAASKELEARSRSQQT